MKSKISDLKQAMVSAIEKRLAKAADFDVQVSGADVTDDLIVRGLLTIHKFFYFFSRQNDIAYTYDFVVKDFYQRISGWWLTEELRAMLSHSLLGEDEMTWEHLQKCDLHFNQFLFVCAAYLETLQGKKFSECYFSRLEKYVNARAIKELKLYLQQIELLEEAWSKQNPNWN